MSAEKVKKDVLGRLIARLEQVAPYADALYSMNARSRLAKDMSDLDFSSDASEGVKIRAFDGQKFHEISIQGWQPQLLTDAVAKLIQRLKAEPVEGKTYTLKIGRERIAKEFATTPIIDPTTVPMKEKVALVANLYQKTMATGEFVNCQAVYREEEEVRVFVSRNKQLSSTWTGCTLAIVPFVRTSDGQTRSDYTAWFANGFEVKNIDEDEFKRYLTRAAKIKTARRIPPGTYTALLSPNVTGLLAHESFGHGMESDTVYHGRAKAEEYLGKRIASAKVSITDDPTLPSTHGFLFFDDEGMIPEPTMLVERGIVKQPITEGYSATRGSYPRSANGRAENFDHKLYARMTNTFFQSGKDDPKTMMKGIKNGLYLHSGSSGMEDPKGWGVQIAGVLAERIKNGKLTGELYYEAAISGYLPDILANITGVGSDFEIIRDVGFCGKNHKEWVRVSSGGPHLLIKELQLS